MLISAVLLSTCYIQLGKSASDSLVINDGDSYASSTSVTLTLSTDFPFLMHFSNTGVFSDIDWEAFSSTKDWTLTSGDGTKTVYVQFKDPFDFISAASDTIILDTSLPSLTINSPVSGSWFNTLSVPVSGTSHDDGSGISTVEYRLNTGTWTSATGTDSWSFTATFGSQGTRTISVRATDNAGYITTDSIVVNIDTVAPVSSVSPLTSYQTSTSFAVSYSSSDASSGVASVNLWVRTPGSSVYADLGPWISGASYTAAAGNGLYQFYSVATDNAGNIEAAPASADASTTVDTQPPTGTININNGAVYTSSASVTLTLSSSADTQSMKFSTDGGLTWTLYEPYSVSKLFALTGGDGEKTVSVMFKDGGGLESTDVISDSIFLDRSQPTTTIVPSGTLGSNDWYISVVSVTLSADDDAGSGVKEIHYVLNGTANVVLGDSAVFDIDTTGTHSLSYWAVDNSGIVETTHVTTVKVDLSVPTTSVVLTGDLLEGESNWYVGPVTVTLNTAQSGSGVSTYYSLDGNLTYQPYTTPFPVTAQGSTLMYYYSTNGAGTKETAKTVEINIAYSVAFTASGLPAGTSWSATLDGSTQSSTETTITFLSKTGEHSWSVTDAISGPAGTRYFESDSQGILNVQSDSNVDVSYVTQFSFTVVSAYGSPTGAGWYDSGSTADFGVSSPVSAGTGVRYVFTMWTGDSSSTNPIGIMVMNGPKAVTANWQTQYQLTFVVSPLEGGTTSPSGSVWVNAGADRSISATAASSNYKFSSWTATAGPISSPTSLSTSITVTGSSTVTANFDQVQAQQPTPTPAPTSNPTTSPTRTPTATSRPTVQPTATPTPAPTEVPSDFVTVSVLTSLSDGTSTHISIYGNIDGSDISNAVITKDQSSGQSTLGLTFIGQSGSNSFCNLTVPIRAISSGTVPTAYINNQVVSNQGYLKDDNYVYVWYNTYLSTYDLSVVFSGQTDFPLWPIGIVIAVSLVLVGGIITPRLRSKSNQPLAAKNEFIVSDYVISDGVLKFYDRKGLFDKKQVPVREVPISKISNIEYFWNELSITWGTVIDIFRKKDNFESFNEEVTSKVQAIIDENKKIQEKEEKIRSRNKDVEAVLNDALPVVDVVFDTLRGLHAKHVDWASIEDTFAILGHSMNIVTQSLPPLNLDFTQLSTAISKQDPREVGNESRSILKNILDYFNSLRQVDAVPEAHPNLDDAAMLVNSYYLLNDIMLGKIVKQKDNPREIHSLERLQQKLAKETSFKLDLESLKIRMGTLIAGEGDAEDIIGDTRELFKDQLLQLYSAL